MSVLNDDLSLNVDSTIKHAEKVISEGCHGVVLFGSTGMAQLISSDEKSYDDPWYLAMCTAWIDDWLIGGDQDFNQDGRIGGYILAEDNSGDLWATLAVDFGPGGIGNYI